MAKKSAFGNKELAGNDLVAHLLRIGVLKTPRIVEAFRRIDRKDFVPPEFEREAYGDYPVPIGFGQTISQPRTVAFMLELLQPEPGDRVLEIGAGSGWVAALLAQIVSAEGEKGKVWTIERIKDLEQFAARNVSKYGFIEDKVATIILEDGAKGLPGKAPFDKIVSAASASFVPTAWKEQLIVGGRMVVPVGNCVEAHDKLSRGDFNIREYKGFRFVPLITGSGGSGA